VVVAAAQEIPRLTSEKLKKMKILLPLLKFVLLPIILVGQFTGWASVNQTLQLIWTAIESGITVAVAPLKKPLRKYLLRLLDIAFIAVLVPLPTAIFGIIARGWLNYEWWERFCEWLTGWSGVWSMVFLTLLWFVATPLAVLVESLLTGEPAKVLEQVKKGEFFVGKKWLSLARTVIMYETFGLFFLSKFPLHHSWVMAAMFILGVFFLIHSGYEWHSETGGWIKPVIRAVMMGIVGIQFVLFIFPGLSPLKFVFRDSSVSSPRDVTNPVLENTVLDGWHWLQANYASAGFIFSIALITVVTTLVAIGISHLKKSSKPGTGDKHPASTAGTDPRDKKSGNWLGVAIGVGVLLLIVIFGVTIVTGCHQNHILKVAEAKDKHLLADEQMATERAKRIPPPRTATTMLVQTRTTSSTAPASNGGEVWHGLKNPTRHRVDFTNALWSPRIPRSPRMEGRLEPNIRPIEVRVSKAGDPPGTGRLYRAGETLKAEDAFLEYRFPGNTNVVSVTIGIGYKN